MRNPTATDSGIEPEKFLFRSDWTLAASGGAHLRLDYKTNLNDKYCSGNKLAFYGFAIITIVDNNLFRIKI
jgi:hypothetical protein